MRSILRAILSVALLLGSGVADWAPGSTQMGTQSHESCCCCGIPAGAETLALFPGSRAGEIKRLLDDFLAVASYLDTAPDFLEYLRQRASLQCASLPLLGHECDLLAQFG